MPDALDTIQTERLVYLVILGTLLVSFGLVYRRVGIGRMVQQIVLWVLLILGVAAAIGLWQDKFPGRSVNLQQATGEALVLRRGRDGHFQLVLDVVGPSGGQARPVRFVVDTGATDIVLRREDAAMLGFEAKDLAYLGTARTANGTVRTAAVWLERIDVGGQSHEQVRALVNEGDLHVSLLGMGFLNRFSRIEIARDRLRLEY